MAKKRRPAGMFWDDASRRFVVVDDNSQPCDSFTPGQLGGKLLDYHLARDVWTFRICDDDEREFSLPLSVLIEQEPET
jgi:hypothetical protein